MTSHFIGTNISNVLLVIPAEAGIQESRNGMKKRLDSGFRQNDDFFPAWCLLMQALTMSYIFF
jgi:hypothetical protein